MCQLWLFIIVACVWTRPHVVSQQCMVRMDLGLPPAARCGESCDPIDLPSEEYCMYDVSECANLQSGELCKVHCKPPYTGSSLPALCPVGDFGETLVPRWERPACEPKCSDPAVMPEGYRKSAGRWQCDESWSGIAKATCRVRDDCSAFLELTGCSPPQMCILDHHQRCAFDTSGCPEPWPGTSCSVRCRSPFIGSAMSTLSCPTGNANASRRVDQNPPHGSCELTCQAPAELPPGYEILTSDDVMERARAAEDENSTESSGMEGDLVCARGFAGRASRGCALKEDCSAYMKFEGCLPLKPCKAPEYDGCEYDFSNCDSIDPGQSCLVSCKAPYTDSFGAPMIATCPADNTEEEAEIQVELRKCRVECYQPRDGYISFPYEMHAGAWRCVDGYAGNATASCTTDENCFPVLDLKGCEPKESCKPPEIPFDEICLYDILDCLNVYAGKTCEVKCRGPYFGESTVGHCPLTNTDAETELVYQKPICNLECPVPDPMPPGYFAPVIPDSGRRKAAPWTCSPGYTGVASEACFTDAAPSCIRRLVLTGCDKLHTCVLPADPPCWIDWAPCQLQWEAPHGEMVIGVWPGGSCTPKCLAPTFLGEPSIANCSDDNINPSLELTYTAPTCTQVCLDPPVSPQGYMSLKHTFQCMDGYVRNDTLMAPARVATLTCAARPKDDCRPVLELSHCAKLVPCRMPKVVPCRFNMTSCASVNPGESCEVRCKAPFFGKALPAFCPSGNTDPEQEVLWVEPDCQIECEAPDPMPAGYIKDPVCGWQCAANAAGTVKARCFADENCNTQLELRGCQTMKPCDAMSLIDYGNDTCRLNISQCIGVMPGEDCIIECKDPYTFNSTVASCPHWNIDPFLPPQFKDLECGLTCADPEPDLWPAGYFLNESTGEWSCRESHTGYPYTWCEVNETCHSNKMFSGCKEIKPCLLPEVDPCEFDMSDCGDGKLMPGGFCTIICLWPYLGYDSTASCDKLNTEDDGLQYILPRCSLGCGEPVGKVGYKKVAGQWFCDTGYTGIAPRVDCITIAGCIVWPELSGCVPVAPCRTLVLSGEEACLSDGAACVNIMPTESCKVSCKEPFVGDGEHAFCPAGNTDPNRDVQYYKAVCRCPWPFPAPTGYWRDEFERWVCDTGYTGIAQAECVVRSDCSHEWIMSGCSLMTPCLSHADFYVGTDNVNICKVNASSCDVVERGGTCDISCELPYRGNVTSAYCPALNTDADRGLRYEPIECEVSCPNPYPIPFPYETGDWQCADGWIGVVAEQCVFGSTPGENCSSKKVFSGCSKLMPCMVPQQTITDSRCMLDFDSCQGLMPGSFCTVKCKPPYKPGFTNAFCPPGNIDPDFELIWTDPHCDLECSTTPFDFVPSGYFRSLTCGWQCDTGYTGIAKVGCDTNADCIAMEMFQGCTLKQPCDSPAAWMNSDPCRYDIDDCLKGVIPAGKSCEVKCKPPYNPNSTFLMCPDDNIIYRAPLFYEEPYCELECPVPDPMIAGYEKEINGSYYCAPGYAGSISVTCVADVLCVPHLTLAGCYPIVPCMAPQYMLDDPCTFDTSDCAAFLPGTSCTVRCNSLYAGRTARLHCPADNTQIGYVPLMSPGRLSCSLVCPDPSPFPEAYTVYEFPSWQDWPTSTSTSTSSHPIASTSNTTTTTNTTTSTTANHTGNTSTSTLTTSTSNTSTTTSTITSSTTTNTSSTTSTTTTTTSSSTNTTSSSTTTNTTSSSTSTTTTTNTSTTTLAAVSPVSPVNTNTTTNTTTVATSSTSNTSTIYSTTTSTNTSSTLSTSTTNTTTTTTVLSKVYECANGYAGNVTTLCEIQEGCMAPLQLFGCRKMVPCAPLQIPDEDTCKFDISACQNMPQGSTCLVSCRWPYHGGATVASCPAENTNENQTLIFQKPSCTFQCPEDMEAVHVPTGAYWRKDMNSSWECASGHVGVASITCGISESCQPKKELSGCIPLRPCVVPPVDNCRVNISDCRDLQPGATCQAACKAPHLGSPVMGSCPALNTDPMHNLTWSEPPRCTCPLPPIEQIPTGHQRNGSAWSCSEGYTGIVVAECVQNPYPDCTFSWSVSGCIKTHPCTAPPSNAASLFASIPDQCDMILQGETCLARCLPGTCVAGGPLKVHCHINNTDPEKIADVTGQCRIRCEVCSLGSLWDVDSRVGYLSGNLPFGPAHAEGGVLTNGIAGYNVYFATACDEKIGEAIVYVPSNSSTPRACCLQDQYIAVLREVPIPMEATRLLITIDTTSSGELPTGLSTNFTDRSGNWTKRPIAATVDSSAADVRLRWSLFLLIVVLPCMLHRQNL